MTTARSMAQTIAQGDPHAARVFAEELFEAARAVIRERLVPDPADQPPCPPWCEEHDDWRSMAGSPESPVVYRLHTGHVDGRKTERFDYSDGQRVWTRTGDEVVAR